MTPTASAAHSPASSGTGGSSKRASARYSTPTIASHFRASPPSSRNNAAPAPIVLPLRARQAISARNAFMTSQLLAAVAREGTAAKASSLLGRWDLYGKTGTTNDAVDAWFCGFQASRVGAVWIGYPQPKSLGERETGGGLALPVWAATMAVALKGQPNTQLSPPRRSNSSRFSVWSGQAG